MVRACSEAVVYAVAKSYCPTDVWQGLGKSFYPRDTDVEGSVNSKLLINVLTGGKNVSSAVKFANFYLIIDAAGLSMNKIDPQCIMKYYRSFLISLKKLFAATKAGEAGFKVQADGSFFNANATIAESFKMMEDAIEASGANHHPEPAEEGAEPKPALRVFQIGINCEADANFNKDPKDPNKYEQEGQKVLFDSNAMLDYYFKMLQDHPLVTYIEDAFAQFDFDAHKAMRDKLQNELSRVNMSLKTLFAVGGINRLKAVTDFSEITAPKVLASEEDRTLSPDNNASASAVSEKKDAPKDAKGKKTPTPAKDNKKTPGASSNLDTPLNQEFPAFDPENPNKNKVTPDCAAITMSQIQTMSQLLNYFVHSRNIDEEYQFRLTIEDCCFDSYLATDIVDLAEGLGAEYLLIKGCQRADKLQKIARFAQLKSD